MKVLVAIVVATVVATVVAAGVKFGLPMAWFAAVQSSIPPAEKADYLGGIFQSVWVLSVASALSGFFGTWIFAAMGNISKFRYAAIFAAIMSAGWLFEPASYLSGSVVASMGLLFSLFGGYLGLQNPPNQSLKSGTPETGAP